MPRPLRCAARYSTCSLSTAFCRLVMASDSACACADNTPAVSTMARSIDHDWAGSFAVQRRAAAGVAGVSARG